MKVSDVSLLSLRNTPRLQCRMTLKFNAALGQPSEMPIQIARQDIHCTLHISALGRKLKSESGLMLAVLNLGKGVVQGGPK